MAGSAFGRTYKQIERLLRGKAISTKTARDIVRKSGVRPTQTTSAQTTGIHPVPILSVGGSRSSTLEDCPCFSTTVFAGRNGNFAYYKGFLYCWGFNLADEYGFMNSRPPENPFNLVSPTRHNRDISDVVDVRSTKDGTILLHSDGTVLTSQDPRTANTAGGYQQPPYLGLQDGLSNIVGIACHEERTSPINSLADGYYYLRNDGTVWGQGAGMAGMGPKAHPYTPAYHWTEDVFFPSQMPTSKVSGVVEISSIADGLIFRKSNGQVGLWRNQDEFPTYPSALPSDPIVRIEGAGETMLALTDQGDIYATGSANTFGTYGNGTIDSTPELWAAWHKANLSGWTDIAGAGNHVLALRNDDLYTWGQGGAASGRGLSASDTGTPTLISGMHGTQSVHGHNASIAPMAVKDGCIYTWGPNSIGFGTGALGLGYAGPPDVGTPTQMTDPDCFGPPVPNPPWPGS